MEHTCFREEEADARGPHDYELTFIDYSGNNRNGHPRVRRVLVVRRLSGICPEYHTNVVCLWLRSHDGCTSTNRSLISSLDQ